MKKITLSMLNADLKRLDYLLTNYKMSNDDRNYITLLALKIQKQIEELKADSPNV